MGTWDVGPFDNDSAADLLVREVDSVEKLIRKARGDERSKLVEYQRRLIETSQGSDILGGYSGKRKPSTEFVVGQSSPAILKKIRSILRMIANADQDGDYAFAGMGLLAILAESHTITNAVRRADLEEVILAAVYMLGEEAQYFDNPADRIQAIRAVVERIA